ncbi:MAG: M20 family metallopeptidase [Gemmatimonadetes bacterium]|nr:M20 family metallopeptidase [Gemmatimonadota bacterium]
MAASHVPTYLELLRQLVERESPSRDAQRNHELAALLATELASRGAAVERHPAPGLGEHVLARVTGARAGEPPLLAVGHMDTVHPVGTLARMPFAIRDGRVTGPGTFDMKGGVAAILVALEILAARRERPARDLVILITCDEEIGSETSRGLIAELARKAHAALVLEPPLSGGAAKTERKGVAGYTISVTGRSAHAGIEPERGASAIHELTHQLARVLALADVENGTTLNVGIVEGGTRVNVVADHARAAVDVRFWTRAEAERVDGALRALRPEDTRCALEVAGGVNRWPVESSPQSRELFDKARAIARAIGFELERGRTGGCSDGNLTHAAGCPTLDGLGIDGGGAHSPDEHILLADVPRRLALLSRLFAEL